MNHLRIIVCCMIFIAMAFPFRAFGAFMADGGKLSGIESQCSCTGGQTIRVTSYADHSNHVYLYQPGVTQEYANRNLQSGSGYFLTTTVPGAVCLDSSEECEGASGQPPEGIFRLTGTSMSRAIQNLASLVEPGLAWFEDAKPLFDANLFGPDVFSKT